MENNKTDMLADMINTDPDMLYKAIIDLDTIQAIPLQDEIKQTITDCIFVNGNIKNELQGFFDMWFENIIELVNDGYITV